MGTGSQGMEHEREGTHPKELQRSVVKRRVERWISIVMGGDLQDVLRVPGPMATSDDNQSLVM